MVLDQMNMENFQSVGGYSPRKSQRTSKKALGFKKNRAKSMRALSFVRKNTKRKSFKRKRKSFKRKFYIGKKTGGSVLADVSVPASLLLFNQFFKNREKEKK